jgi:hypothetical protein
MFDIRQSKAHSVGTITVAIFLNIGFAGQSSVCNSVELGKTVKITVTEADSSNNIIGTGNGTMLAGFWCAEA